MAENNYSNRITEDVYVEDRLSSLPDDILIDIISLLEIHNAAATSVLSRRWRHLWTAVTRLKFLDPDIKKVCPYRDWINFLDMFRQLTSPKLYAFSIHHVKPVSVSCAPNVVEECVRELRCRKVEQIKIHINNCHARRIPVFHTSAASLFQIQTLVTLDLKCKIQLPDNAPEIQLPNLKKLHMAAPSSIPSWLGTLFSSCPLLEDLQLICYLDRYCSLKPHPDLQIFAPNLKSLHIELFFPDHFRRTKIFIDAPILTSLTINDCSSCYYFVQKPLGLIKASINLTFAGPEVHVRDDYYEHYMSKFLAALSNVRELQLKLFIGWEQRRYVENYNYSPKTTVYSDLVSLRTAIDGMGLEGWKGLLRSLQRFPKLNHLKLDIKTANHGSLICIS